MIELTSHPSIDFRSADEKRTYQYLVDKGFNVKREITAPDLKNPKTGQSLYFDLLINDKVLVEIDGMQHYKESNYQVGDDFKEQIYRDNFKNNWAYYHLIPLVRVAYSEQYLKQLISQINIDLDILQATPNDYQKIVGFNYHVFCGNNRTPYNTLYRNLAERTFFNESHAVADVTKNIDLYKIIEGDMAKSKSSKATMTLFKLAKLLNLDNAGKQEAQKVSKVAYSKAHPHAAEKWAINLMKQHPKAFLTLLKAHPSYSFSLVGYSNFKIYKFRFSPYKDRGIWLPFKVTGY